ncbi:S8 family peptidase [Chitinophaga rhizosphaerae]|uniref:S8 family peptidase n=1 Tax=Chitinophaga rhizosphaerae TaxID=1864947 RepID=UPI000F811723|nr:S8 family peptidase [Chitinophaga rhizosphaerae]
MSARYVSRILSLVAIMAAILHLRLHAQESRIVQRYATGTAMTASDRRGTSEDGFFLVRFPNVPEQSVLDAWGWIKSLHPRYHIVRKLFPDSTVVSWQSNYNWKASTKLIERIYALHENDSITLIADAAGTARVLGQPAANVYEIRIAVKDWPALSADPRLRLADVPRRPHSESASANADLSINRVNALHAEMPGLRGNGMRISLKETLYDTLDIDLHPRHIRHVSEPARTETHATLMATLIAGNGNSGPGGLGVAPRAMIASSDFSRLLPDDAAIFSNLQIHAQNHSYGTGIENYYGLEAVAYDAQVRELDTFLHVFSSGNIGTDAPAEGIYSGLTGFANLSGSFKQAKNILVVGATDGNNITTPRSSRGPAFDGRIKPELVAYGEGGTSDAAALVSGIGLLLQEQFRLQSGAAPSAALLAAILINSAKDLGTPGPDFITGFGAVDAHAAARTILDHSYATGIVGQGNTFQMPVPAGTGTLRVTMRYTDREAPANSVRALANDLDLWLTDASGNRFDPWTLSTFPHKDSLTRAAIPGRDSLNNTEQVLARSAAGGLTVHVQGRNVSGSQTFALAWQWIPDGYFEWDAPATGETLDAGVAATLRWSTNISGPGKIFYQQGESGNWQPLTDVQDVNEGQAKWETPPAFGPMQLRMDVAGKSFTGPQFLVAPRLRPATGFICKDSALVWWAAASGAFRYRVYALENDAYRLLSETADTTFAFRTSTVVSGIVAVSAIAQQEGPRSPAHRFSANAPGCYVRNFTADLDASGAVQLQLELGTPVGLRNIRWFRQGMLLGSTTPGNGFVYAATDERPPQGITYYYAELELANGRLILTDAVPVAHTGADEYLLFPNPAGEWIRLLAKGLRGQQIVVTDMQGRVRKSLRMESLQQEIPLIGLPAGNYWIGVYENGKRQFGTRFVKVR